MVNSTPWKFFHHEKETCYRFYGRLFGTQGWSGQVRKFSLPTWIRLVDRSASSVLLYGLSSAGPLLMCSFGSNESTSHSPKHLYLLYRIGVLIGYSARESAVVSCLTGEIAVVAPHREVIVLLRNWGHPSCHVPTPASGWEASMSPQARAGVQYGNWAVRAAVGPVMLAPLQ